MDAIMQALLGGDALADDDKMRQTAEALRSSDNAAQVFALSSIPDIAKAAQGQRSIIQDAALRGGRARQIGLEKAANRKQKAADLERERLIREEQRRQEIEDRDAKIESDENVAKIKAAGDGGSNLPKYTAKDIEKLSDFMANTDNFMTLVDDALAVDEDGKPRFELSTGMGAKSEDKFDRILEDYAPGLQSERTRASLNWWNNYEKYYNAKERKGLFGSQFTPSEQKQWEAMSISRGDPEKVIRQRLRQQREFLRSAAQRRIRDARMRKMTDPEIRSYVGNKYDALMEPIKVYSSNQAVNDKKGAKLKKSVAAVNGPNANAVVAETPTGKKAVIVPDEMPQAAIDAGVSPEDWAKASDEDKKVWRD